MKLTVTTVDGHSYLDVDYTEEIQRGAAALDEAVPGWENAIDPSELMLISNDKCVLGQISISNLLPEDLKEKLGTYDSGEPRRGYNSFFYALFRSGFIKKRTFSEDNDLAAARYGFYVWEGDLSQMEVDPEHFKIEHSSELVPVSMEAASVIRRPGSTWYWEQLTEQWKIFINERLGRSLKETTEIEKTVEEIVASVGAQPQPVFTSV